MRYVHIDLRGSRDGQPNKTFANAFNMDFTHTSKIGVYLYATCFANAMWVLRDASCTEPHELEGMHAQKFEQRTSGNFTRANTLYSLNNGLNSHAASDVTAQFRLKRARREQQLQKERETQRVLASKVDGAVINNRVSVTPVDGWLQTLSQHPLADGLRSYVVRKGRVVSAVFKFQDKAEVGVGVGVVNGKRVPNHIIVIARAIATTNPNRKMN